MHENRDDVLTSSVGVRLKAAEDAKLEAIAKEMGMSKARAARTSVVMMLAQHDAGGSLPTTQSDRQVLAAWAADYSTYKEAVSAALARLGYDHPYHADFIASELAADRSLVTDTARCYAIDKAITADNVLEACLLEWMKSNPGSEFYELPRSDVAWLELGFGDHGASNQQHVTYVVAMIDRETVADRWRRHRRLLAEMVARGEDYRPLFHYCEKFKGPALVSRPKLRSYSQGGIREYEVGEPNARKHKAPVMSEADAVVRGIRGGKIGGVQPAEKAPTRVRRGTIGNGSGETP